MAIISCVFFIFFLYTLFQELVISSLAFEVSRILDKKSIRKLIFCLLREIYGLLTERLLQNPLIIHILYASNAVVFPVTILLRVAEQGKLTTEARRL